MPTALEALEGRLSAALEGSPLQARIATAAAPLLERRARDAAAEALDGPALSGLARALAANPEAGRYLSLRPALFARITGLAPDSFERRAAELVDLTLPDPSTSREDFLDALRLLRRDELVFAAAAHLAGLAPFERVAEFLSLVAESCAARALAAVEGRAPSEAGVLTVLGMGKLAGREFTYHSDLDVIFLFRDDVADADQPSRLAQRWISSLATMTGAGFAYHVDSRLRPSGQQGALVTTVEAFARYQTQQAATWEHVALQRARALAGDCARVQAGLERVRERIAREAGNPWRYLRNVNPVPSDKVAASAAPANNGD